MRDKKYYIALDDFERRVVVNCLNEVRNSLIANGKYTDDDVELSFFQAEFIEQFVNLGQVLLRGSLIVAIIGNIFFYDDIPI
ncbi:MAG: hypothetical protein J6C41_08695 [Oscillospiraceae bacterium]|nr:hypothetical protein [Oscillospiraceae bacterium]